MRDRARAAAAARRSARVDGVIEPHRPVRRRSRRGGARRGPPRARARARAPVSASRSARRSPPTAFSSRTSACASASTSRSPRSRSSRKRSSVSRGSVGQRDRLGLERSSPRYSRASTRSRAPRSAGASSTGAPARAASSSSVIAAIASTASRADPRRGRGGRRAAAARARRGRRAPPRPGSRVAQRRRPIAPSARFESFCPSSPRISPWWMYSGGSRAERLGQRAVQRLVRPVVVAADHVRDPEVDVVDDGRELVGRRAVRPQQRRSPIEARSRPRRARPAASRWRVARARSGAPAPRPSRSRATRGRRGSPPRRPGRCAPGRCRRSAAASSSPKARFATAVSALPRCSEPVGLGAKRTLFMAASLGVRFTPT